MKAANLLISNDGYLKIADFGLARSIEDYSKGRASHFGSKYLLYTPSLRRERADFFLYDGRNTRNVL